MWLPPERSPTGDLARNPGMCPDWESNWQPFGSQPSLNPLSYTSQVLSLFILFIFISFPFAAVTNDHEPGGFRQQNVFSYTSGGQKSDTGITGPKPRFQQSHPEVWKGSISLPLSASGSRLGWGPFLQLQNQGHRPIRIVQGNLPI